MTLSIDVDEPSTWPAHLFARVSELAQNCRGGKYTCDLPIPLEDEKSFARLFEGHLLRAYHYTCLLPHEPSMIRGTGLRVLSAQLLSDRIEAARMAGEVSDCDAERLHSAHVFAAREERYREGRVCLVLSKRHFEQDPDGLLPLVTTWGGEGIYMSSLGVPLRELLEKIGKPTVVAALIDVGRPDSNDLFFPPIQRVFVGSLLGLKDACEAETHYFAHIPPEHIVDIESVQLP